MRITRSMTAAHARQELNNSIAKANSADEDVIRKTSINDLPIEVLRMILEGLYHQVALRREPSFYAASCVARKWTHIAYDLSFFRFYRFSHGPDATVSTIKTATKLQALSNSEGLRRAAVAAKFERLRDELYGFAMNNKRSQSKRVRVALNVQSVLASPKIKIEEED